MKLINRCYCMYKHYGLKQTIERVLFHLHLIPHRNMDNRILQEYSYYMKLPLEKYEEELKNWYGRATGRKLDLNNPQTFNEKIQWLKLYDSTPLKTKLADKYLVREWIKEKIGEEYLIPLLGVWDKFDDIDFDKLPKQFVLKTNHGSGWNIIVKDKDNLDKEDAKKKFDLWLKLNYAFISGFEMQYLNIPPKIIAEQYIADLDGDIYDYRFFCFAGKATYIWVDIGSGTQQHKRNIYNIDWELQNYHVNYPSLKENLDKPKTFDEMLTCAEKFAKEFTFIRIDFYSVNEKVYFGEMTFTPQSGTGKWESEEQNKIYGNLIKLPKRSPIPKLKG